MLHNYQKHSPPFHSIPGFRGGNVHNFPFTFPYFSLLKKFQLHLYLKICSYDDVTLPPKYHNRSSLNEGSRNYRRSKVELLWRLIQPFSLWLITYFNIATNFTEIYWCFWKVKNYTTHFMDIKQGSSLNYTSLNAILYNLSALNKNLNINMPGFSSKEQRHMCVYYVNNEYICVLQIVDISKIWGPANTQQTLSICLFVYFILQSWKCFQNTQDMSVWSCLKCSPFCIHFLPHPFAFGLEGPSLLCGALKII